MHTETFSVTVLTDDSQELTFHNVPGPKEQARATAQARFRRTRPETGISEILVCPTAEVYDSHACRDDDGGGSCSVCGGAITGSWLDKELNGGD